MNGVSISRDVLNMVFSYLDSKNVVNGRLVCRSWRDKLEDIVWKLACKERWECQDSYGKSWKERFQIWQNWNNGKSVDFIHERVASLATDIKLTKQLVCIQDQICEISYLNKAAYSPNQSPLKDSLTLTFNSLNQGKIYSTMVEKDQDDLTICTAQDSYIITGDKQLTIRVFNLAGQLLRKFDKAHQVSQEDNNYQSYIRALACNDKWVASTVNGGNVKVWDIKTGKCLYEADTDIKYINQFHCLDDQIIFYGFKFDDSKGILSLNMQTKKIEEWKDSSDVVLNDEFFSPISVDTHYLVGIALKKFLKVWRITQLLSNRLIFPIPFPKSNHSKIEYQRSYVLIQGIHVVVAQVCKKNNKKSYTIFNCFDLQSQKWIFEKKCHFAIQSLEGDPNRFIAYSEDQLFVCDFTETPIDITADLSSFNKTDSIDQPNTGKVKKVVNQLRRSFSRLNSFSGE